MGDADPSSGRLTAKRRRRFESRDTSNRVAYPRDTGGAAVDRFGAARLLASLELACRKDHHRRTGRGFGKPLGTNDSHAQSASAAVVGDVGMPEEDDVALRMGFFDGC